MGLSITTSWIPTPSIILKNPVSSLSKLPSFTICQTTASIGQGLMRSEMLIALAEGAVFFVGRFFGQGFSLYKIVGSLGTLYSNDHSLFRCRILS
jgi:hypothetical protein